MLHQFGEDEEKYAEFIGDYYINATAKTQPDIFDLNKKDIDDVGEVYSGCYVRGGLNFYFYNNKAVK